MNTNRLLPIGSIVLLKGGEKKVMITGYCMKLKEEPDKIYDYSCCVFPQGIIKSTITSVFNHDQIDKIYFIGYHNDESVEFFKQVDEQLNNK